MKTLLLLLSVYSVSVFAQKDSINVVDPFGQRQGMWRLTGDQAPELGVEPGALAEEGTYLNNQKIGPWVRYDKKGTKPISLVYFQYNESGNSSSRVAMFPYKFYDDGTPQYTPYPGLCPTKANYKRFGQTGNLIEVMEYDSAGNETYTVSEVSQGDLDQMSYFMVPANFTERPEKGVALPSTPGFSGFSGTFIVDFKHTTFVSGTFVNGKLVDGKEVILDDSYTPTSIRTFKGGVYVTSFFP